jgi:ParB/RepB/Spo0J family partition protein
MATAIDLFVNLEPESPDAPAERLDVDVPAGARSAELQYIPRTQIHPDPFQPRKNADADLRANIARRGMLEPVGVRPIPPMEGVCECCACPWVDLAASGDYMLIFGERRWRSSEGVLTDLPAIVRTDLANRLERLLTQAAENAHRAMAPLDEARLFHEIVEETGWSHSRVGAETGRKRQTVTDRLSLLKNPAWIPLLESGEITSSQLVETSRYADRDAETHEIAIRTMRDVAGDGGLAAMEVSTFREQLRTIAYFDPNAPQKPAPPAQHQKALDLTPVSEPIVYSTDQASIADVEQAAGESVSVSGWWPAITAFTLESLSPEQRALPLSMQSDEWVSSTCFRLYRHILELRSHLKPGDARLAAVIKSFELDFFWLEQVATLRSIRTTLSALDDFIRGVQARRDFATAAEGSFQEIVLRPINEAAANTFQRLTGGSHFGTPLVELSDRWLVSAIQRLGDVYGAEEDHVERSVLSLDLRLLQWEAKRRGLDVEAEARKEEPAYQQGDTMESSVGTAPAGLENQLSQDEAPSNAEARGVSDAQSLELPEPSLAGPGSADDSYRCEDCKHRVRPGVADDHAEDCPERLAGIPAATATVEASPPRSAVTPSPSTVPPEPKQPAPTSARAAAQEVSGNTRAAGVFELITEMVGDKPMMITVARHADRFRVNLIPSPGGTGKLSTPLTIDGAPAAIDDLLFTTASKHLGRTTAARSVPPAATSAESPKTKAPAAARKKSGSKPAVKPAPKPAAPRRAPAPTKKPAAKKPARKKPAAKPPVAKKAATPRKPKLYPDPLLAAVLLSQDAIGLPGALRGVMAYAKKNDLLGDGPTRGMISCDDKLRALFGTRIVKAGQVAKLLAKHVVPTLPDPANQLDWTKPPATEGKA